MNSGYCTKEMPCQDASFVLNLNRLTPGPITIFFDASASLPLGPVEPLPLEYRYDPPFKFTGKIGKVIFRLKPEPSK